MLAACAALFLVVGQVNDPAADITDSHIRSLQASHLMDVIASDQHVVKPWFDGRLDFAPPVIDLKEEGFPIIGGRLDYIGRRAVAAIVYRRGRHIINLFVWPASGAHSADENRQSQGYSLRHWTGAGMNWWVVSDVNPADLAQLETRLKRRAGE